MNELKEFKEKTFEDIKHIDEKEMNIGKQGNYNEF